MNTYFENLETILTVEELNRVVRFTEEEQMTKLTIDVHHMKAKDALRMVKNAIAIKRSGSLELEVIHGYIHGDSIKNTIRKEKLSNRELTLRKDQCNAGHTFICLNAA